jgi:ribosomal subunit interface protein
MQVSVTGKQIDVGDALRGRVDERLTELVSKYFDSPIDGTVVFSREGKGKQLRADISVHVGRGILMQGQGEADEAHAAFDTALERIAKQLRRYKRRLRDHHRKPGAEVPATFQAQQYVIAANDEEETEEQISPDGQPVVIAEMTSPIEAMTVGEAVMRMDLADVPAMVFMNSAHGGINVVYRRADGHIGWVDPTGNPDRA